MAFLLNKEENDYSSTDFHFPTSRKALIIFTRNPELGNCKTRLAAIVGDKNALEIYKILLQHTVQITKHLEVDKFVYYSNSVVKEDNWDNTIYRKKKQEGLDLGNRMENAFADLFTSGYEKVIIIGSDIYDLSREDLEIAYQNLENNDFVMGPASDGGYYLLGMKKLEPTVFKNKSWGTNTVFDDTMTDLKNSNIWKLPVRNDIDIYEDIVGLDIFQPFIVKQ
jgi:rSAM/selenodomain-associated transferase 1